MYSGFLRFPTPSLRRKPESSIFREAWIPACARNDIHSTWRH